VNDARGLVLGQALVSELLIIAQETNKKRNEAQTRSVLGAQKMFLGRENKQSVRTLSRKRWWRAGGRGGLLIFKGRKAGKAGKADIRTHTRIHAQKRLIVFDRDD